jgi:phospholipid/cholesterol/gamma-HCH transport system permease protein
MLEDVGRGTIGFLDYAGGVATLAGEAGSVIGRLRIRVGETFAQAYFLGVQSTAIVLLTSLFTGMVISLESANQAKSSTASRASSAAPSRTCRRANSGRCSRVVVAGRAGAAIAAELGSMVVTEQIEALEALGLSPVQMLVVPRLLALVLMLPILTIFADVIAIVGGMYLATTRRISATEIVHSIGPRVQRVRRLRQGHAQRSCSSG